MGGIGNLGELLSELGLLGLRDQLLDGLLLLFRQGGIQLQQLPPGSDRAAGIIFCLQPDHAKVEQRVGIFWIVSQSLLQLRDRAIGVALIKEAGGQVGARADILGIGFDRFLVVSRRLWELMGCLVESSELIQQNRVLGIGLEFCEQRLGLFVGHVLQVVEAGHLRGGR